MTNQKIQSEQEMRQGIIKQALRFYGPEGARQVRMHFHKYDKLLANCHNETEKAHIKRLAIAELYHLMGYQQGITVGGEVLIPPDKTE